MDFKVNDAKFIVTVLLLGLSLFTALLLQSQMSQGYVIELVIIFIGIILTAGILFGMWIDEKWTHAIITLFFSAAMLNATWLYISTNAFLVFTFGLLVNVAGLVICMSSMKMPWIELETYDIQHNGKKRKKK